MSEEHLALVRRFYAEADPMTALKASIAADIEVDLTSVYPDRPVLKGLDEARRFRDQGPWGEITFEPERFLEIEGERVLVFVRARATGRESGVPVEAPSIAHEFTFRGGLLIRFSVYSDRGKALEAAGLAE
jgi:hypothetical protein